jgi:hypothetical protein
MVQKPAMGPIPFRKSSYSNATGECVEVAPYPTGLVAVRDSKDAVGSWLVCTAVGWQEFVTRLREGRDPVPADR